MLGYHTMRIGSVALALATILTSMAWAATPDTKPASASAKAPASASRPTPPTVLADTFLRAFPASANSLGGRPDAHNLHVEGRVREIHPSTQPGGETRLILVGSAQADEAAAHFTCLFDTPPDDVKPEQIIRLVGTVGPVTASADRVELLNCHDATVVGDPTVGNRIAGFWRCNSVVLDGAVMHKEAVMQGKKADDIPITDFASPLRMDLVIRADNSFIAELWNGETLVRKVAGKCVITKDGPDTAQARLEGGGGPSVEAPISMESDHLKITLPGFIDKHIVADTSFEKVKSVPQNVDWKALKNQTLAWFAASNSIAKQQVPAITTTLSNALDKSALAKDGFVCTLGSQMLKKGRAVALVAAYGKLNVLEFNDAENQHDDKRKNIFNYGEIPAWGELMVPEVKLDNIIFDKKGAIDPAQPITGKVTLRSLRRFTPAPHALVMATQGSLRLCTIDHMLEADPDTYTFHFEPLAQGLQANMGATIPMIFYVARLGNDNKYIISEPVIALADLAGR
jgi:hypothetical protein